MSAIATEPPSVVSENELLARFILQSNRVRADGSVKPDAFIPFPLPNLSVTRHLGWDEEQIWTIGRAVAAAVRKRLHARADVAARVFTHLRLRVVAAPVEDNPHHANVTDWPADKPSQKAIAQEIAAAAGRAMPATS